MKIWRFLFLFSLLIFGLALTACSSKPKPEDIYWQYWEKCSEGKFSQAEKHLSEDARSKTQMLGTCGFTHDAINTIEIANGNPERTFSEEPEVTIRDGSAAITWYDDQGNIATVVLVEINGEWKVTEAIWSR